MRYNIFNNIHKALRYLIYEVTRSTAVYESGFEKGNGEPLFTKMLQTLDFFSGHAAQELEYIVPRIAPLDGLTAAKMSAFHRQNELLMEQIRSEVAKFYRMGAGDHKRLVATTVHSLFMRFIAGNLEQMIFEESIVSELLWATYSDRQLMDIFNEIASALAPHEVTEISRLMMRSLSNAEITQWLSMVKYQAPADIFDFLLDLGERELPLNRWQLIQNTLSDGVRFT